MPNPANPQTLNRYSYCLNNPLKYVDPSGHFFAGALAAAVAGANAVISAIGGMGGGGGGSSSTPTPAPCPEPPGMVQCSSNPGWDFLCGFGSSFKNTWYAITHPRETFNAWSHFLAQPDYVAYHQVVDTLHTRVTTARGWGETTGDITQLFLLTKGLNAIKAAGATGVVAGATEDLTLAQRINGYLAANAKMGANGVAEVSGSTMETATSCFAEWGAGGSFYYKSTSTNLMVKLDDGFITLRTSSSYLSPNTIATIDTRFPGVYLNGNPIEKIKFNP